LFGIALIVLLATLASIRPVTIGPMANPADPTYLPRPEWYYIPVFQWLKYWHGPASVVGIILIPALLFIALFALPFIDRSPERRPLKRPIALGTLFIIFGGLIWLGARSHEEDHRDPAAHAKLAAQEEEERRFARAPFEPEHSLTACAAAAVKLSGPESRGAALFVSESCAGCHGPEGKGGAGLFRLAGLNQKFPGDQLKAILRKPNATMLEGGMEPIALKEEDLDAVIAYLRVIAVDREK
jgi:mono/diheme cytochrome c family protein